MELRRFEMLQEKDQEDQEKFFKWCDKKGLSREDLIYILRSIKLRDYLAAEDKKTRVNITVRYW